MEPRTEPGKRTLVLGVNGWGNLAAIVGSQLYRQQYAPQCKIPFYVTLIFVAVSLLGYLSYRFVLHKVNRWRLAILENKTEVEIANDRVDETRYADRKWTFIYGL